MVVTRRTPVVPPAPVSRTQSSQGQLRSVRAAEVQDPSVAPRVSSPLVSGDAPTAVITPGTSNDFKEHNHKVSLHPLIFTTQISGNIPIFYFLCLNLCCFDFWLAQCIIRG